MKTHRRLLFTLLVIPLVCLNSGPISAQRTVKKADKKPIEAAPLTPISLDDNQTIVTVERLLSESGQKYVTAGAGIWVIRRNGPNLTSFQIVLSSIAGTLITEVIVAPAKSVRLEAASPYLLRLADKLDYVKIGLDTGDDLFVRHESRVKSLNVEELKNNIDRVAAAADKMFVEIKPFRQAYQFTPR